MHSYFHHLCLKWRHHALAPDKADTLVNKNDGLAANTNGVSKLNHFRLRQFTPLSPFLPPAASKKQRVRFSNIMEVRQLPSTQALEAKLSRMSYPAAKDHEAMLRTVGKLTITDVAKISFFFCFVVSKSQQECQLHPCMDKMFPHNAWDMITVRFSSRGK